MNEFERALSRELHTLDAPEGFADRVMQRIAQQSQRIAQQTARKQPAPSSPRWRMALAAALLLTLGGAALHAGYDLHQRHQAEATRAQFALAMQVTTRSLKAVDRGLAQIDKTSSRSTGDTQ